MPDAAPRGHSDSPSSVWANRVRVELRGWDYGAGNRFELIQGPSIPMRLSPTIHRALPAAVAASLMLAALAPMASRSEPGPVKVRASETSHAVAGTHDFEVSADSTHIAIHWAGHPDAVVTAAFSTDGDQFSEPTAVEVDEGGEGPDVGLEKGSPETYGSLMGVHGIRVVRVRVDRPLARVTVLALDAAGPDPAPMGLGAQAAGATPIPTIISRAGWGADETIRFDGAGDERWPREFFPLQKLVVHHTAGRNQDPNPTATVRAIYYYHAVSRRWGDIGYNYLIDEAGRIYEGRYGRDFWNGTQASSDNALGQALAGGHAKYHNQGSMGISLLGTFSTQAPTAAARASLVRLLAWASAKYHLDPRGTSTYVNPQTGVRRTTPNITGHRDYQATSCPGAVLNAQLPAIRSDVAAARNLWPGELYNPQRMLSFAAGSYTGYKFNAGGAITSSKPYTLTKASSAPTNQRATNPVRSGSWYFVTAGVWAGYWVQGSTRTSVSPAAATQVLEEFATARPVTVPAGTKTGRKFESSGHVRASKTVTFASSTVVWATKRSTIPYQLGRWYYVTAGAWKGYWIPETTGMTLGAPPPPLPQPIAIYSPPRTLRLAPGTYVGRQYSAYGILAGSYSYTLTTTSSAPTSRYSTLPGQTGRWYYIVDGTWDTYWIRESSGTTLAP